MVFQQLINNVALLIGLSLLYSFVARRFKSGGIAGQILNGLIFGGLTIALMSNPFTLSKGLIFDTRSVVLVLSGIFGGPLTAGIAAVICSLFRIYQGGVGTVPAVAMAFSTAGVGTLHYFWIKKNPAVKRLPHILLSGLAAHVAMCLCMLLLPWPMGPRVLFKMAPAVLSVLPLATVLVAKLLLDQEARLKAELDLKKSELSFRTIADFTYDWEIWRSPTGEMIYVSPSCARISGYTADEFISDPELVTRIVHPDDREILKEHLKICHSPDAGVGGAELRIIHKDGREVWLSHVCNPVHAPDGAWLGRRISNRDITTEKQAAGDKILLEKQLVQAQKMEAIGTLAGGIAHDFNNILAVMMGNTELVLADLPPGSPRAVSMGRVLEAGERASSLVKQILSFSRNTPPQKEMVNTHQVIEETVKMLRATLPSYIEIKTSLDGKAGFIMADPGQIHQVLMNLGSNAAQAMGEAGGVLEIKLTLTAFTELDTQQNQNLPPGTDQKITVTDSGPGIPPEVLPRLFDPFFTTKEVGKGTGLGLSVVEGVVSRLGGGISVYSRPGQGASFHVFLPLAREQAADLAAPPTEMPRGNGERILAVDDEPALVEVYQRILGSLGYRVTTMTNSAEALQLLLGPDAAFDLLVTDYTMPELTGLGLVRRLRERGKNLPIVLCTGFATLSLESQLADLEVEHLLLKPVSSFKLAEVVSRALVRHPA